MPGAVEKVAGVAGSMGGAMGSVAGAVGQGMTKEQQAQIDEAVSGQQQAGKKSEEMVSEAGKAGRADIASAAETGRSDISGGVATGRADLNPYAKTGTLASADLMKMATGQWDFSADPGYTFRVAQGEQAINRNAGAGGSPYSGATLKALGQFNSDIASAEYGNAYARRAGTLSTLGGMGLTAAGQSADLAAEGGVNMAGVSERAGQATANSRADTAQKRSDLRTGAADAGAAGAMAKANIATESTNSVLGAGATAGATVGAAALLAPVVSDRRAKTNIIPADDIVRTFLDELAPYSFEYIEPDAPGAGPGRHVGVMAQDAERSEAGAAIVFDAERGKMIDTRRGVGLLLASVAHLNRRVRELEQTARGERHG